MNRDVTRSCSFRELRMQRSEYRHVHAFTAETGKQCPCFGFLCRGTLHIELAGGRLVFPESSLFYIPAQARYRSVFLGAPEILFYGLHLQLLPSAACSQQQFALQRIEPLSNAQTQASLERLYALLQSDEPASQLRAFALFYEFYAQALPLLKPADRALYPPQIAEALLFIERNFCRQLSVRQIADACYLSQSRLFALFRLFLGTTPVGYLNALRIEKAAGQLRVPACSVQQIAAQCGFRSEDYFRQVFRRQTGMTPLEYRRSCLPAAAEPATTRSEDSASARRRQ